MALGLEELAGKRKSDQFEGKSHQRTHRQRPWAGTIQEPRIEVTEESEIKIEVEVIATEESITGRYSSIARQAVDRAREIVSKNEKMLQEIYSRRQGADVRPLERSDQWTFGDEHIFYLQDFNWQNPKDEGAFKKVKRFFLPRH